MPDESQPKSQPKGKKPSRVRSGRSTRDKGDVVEDIVALLYDNVEGTVAKRVPVPVTEGTGESREVDVLISRSLAGKAMHVPIECKNYGGRVTMKELGEFVLKLDDIGIPRQHGIFVSVNGYESGALRTARKNGIQTLVLSGLTPDRFAAQVHEAFQSVVYLLLDVTRITVRSEAGPDDAWKLPWFRDENGRFCGGLLDFSIEIPRGWCWSAGGTSEPNRAEVEVHVVGKILIEIGTAERFVLADAETGELERVKIQGRFEDSGPGPKTYPLLTARSEAELADLLEQPTVARVTLGRIPLPRIRYDMFWPPSQRAFDYVFEKAAEALTEAWWRWWILRIPFDSAALLRKVQQGMSFSDIEGTDLKAIWEPIMPSHPAAKDMRWPFSPRRRVTANPTNLSSRPRRPTARRGVSASRRQPSSGGSDKAA